MNKQNIALFKNRDLLIIFSVTLISVMGVTSIAPAFPRISEDLSLSKKTVSLLITVFTLPGIFLSPLLGIMADRIGRKRILVPSLFLFGIAGTACAFITDFRVLLAVRFVQGLGAASLGSLNLAIIGDIFSGRDRITAMGYNASVLGVGAMVYPAVGGSVALLGWNYPFFLSILAVPVGMITLFMLDSPDFSIQQKMGHYLRDTLKYMMKARIVSLYMATLSIFILLYGSLIAYFPFFMRENFGSSSSTIGLYLASASIATSAGAFNLGRLTHIFSQRRLILLSFLLYAGAILMSQFIKSITVFIIPVLIFGFANGINIPSIQSGLSDSVDIEQRGAFMSINSMVLRTGQTIGPLCTGIVFELFGMEGVFYGSAIFALASFAVLKFTLKD